jgi:hypothetical protein
MEQSVELSTFLAGIKKHLHDQYPDPVWIHGRILSFQILAKAEHIGLVLQEINPNKCIHPECSGRIWAHDKVQVLKRMASELGSEFPVGVTGWWQVQPDLIPKYGFQLIVHDCSKSEPDQS